MKIGEYMDATAAPECAAHTPGPWQANASPIHDGGHPFTIWGNRGPGYGMVAHVAPYCPPRPGQTEYAVKGADARLIASAPTLLASLRGMANVARDIICAYDDVLGTESEPGWIEDLAMALAETTNAIAAAVGGGGAQ